jgi:hypothetical protein
MSTKAQIQGQVFVFLLALVIVAVILFLGYKGVQMISSQAQKAQLDKFKDAITHDVQLYQDYGSASEAIKYSLPSSVQYVCFLNAKPYDPRNELCDSASDNYHLIACNAWSGNEFPSVFIIPPQNNFELKIQTLSVNGGAFCLKTSLGSIYVKYVGEGDKTQVKA